MVISLSRIESYGPARRRYVKLFSGLIHFSILVLYGKTAESGYFNGTTRTQLTGKER